MGAGTQILQLLAGEDVNGDQMNLGVAVLASLRSAHFNNLARAALDDDMAVLAKGGTLHREGGRGAGIGGVELHLMLEKKTVSFARVV